MKTIEFKKNSLYWNDKSGYLVFQSVKNISYNNQSFSCAHFKRYQDRKTKVFIPTDSFDDLRPLTTKELETYHAGNLKQINFYSPIFKGCKPKAFSIKNSNSSETQASNSQPEQVDENATPALCMGN